MNKNGFINLGLIFIILSSAFAMISFTSVKGSMTSTKDKSFVITAQTYLKSAEIWYATESLRGDISSDTCVTFNTLYNNNYVEYNDYDGYVEFKMNNESEIYITDGYKMIYGATSDELDTSVEDASGVKFTIPSYCK